MRVAVVTEAEEDTRVSAAVAMRAELVVATVEPGSVMVVAVMARAITHPGSRRDATAATAAMGKRYYAPRSSTGGQIMVPARERKIKLLPGSLLGRQSILVAITSRKIDPALVLRVSPLSSRVIMREKIGHTSSTRAQLQRMQPGPAAAWSRQNAANRQRLDPQTKERLHNWQGKAHGWNDAKRNHKITGKIAITMTMIGGIIIATLLFLLAEVIGAGMADGGIRPGVMTRIILITIIMVRSMAMRPSTRRGNCQCSGSVAATGILRLHS